MAHHQFELLKVLLSFLDDERNDIYLHLDRKVKNPPVEALRAVLKKSPLVLTKKRYNVSWGSAEQSMAEMQLYHTAASTGKEYAYYHLMSGSCLPVKSQDDIHRFFTSSGHAGRNFLFVHPNASRWDYERFSKYHFRRRNRLTLFLNRLQSTLKIDRIRGRFPIFRRGHNWCSLTHQAVDYLLQHKREIIQLVKHTLNSDEGYKQLYLLNAPQLNNTIMLNEDGKTPDLWYTDWSAGGTHPRTLTKEDFPLLTSIPQLFARKFSENHMDVALQLHKATTKRISST